MIMKTTDFIRSTCTRYFRNDAHVLALYLFGSYASNQAHENSDIDLAILYQFGRSPSFYAQRQIHDGGHLVNELKTDNVDFIVLNTTSSTALRYAVVQDGICMIDNFPELTNYELNTKREFFDFKESLQRAGYLKKADQHGTN